MRKSMYDVLDNNIKSKRFVGGFGRLKKDGTISPLNGQVFFRKTSKSGDEYILLDNFLGNKRKGQKKRWQMVLVKNIVALNENGWKHTKVAA